MKTDILYHELATDTDLVMKALPTGFETFAQLRSPASPERVDFRFELPERASLALTPDGGAAIVRDGQPVLVLLPPAAVDAQGKSVPASYVVSGNTLEVHAAHRERDVAYPVLVDPVGTVPGGGPAVVENWATDPRSWYHDSTLDRSAGFRTPTGRAMATTTGATRGPSSSVSPASAPATPTASSSRPPTPPPTRPTRRASGSSPRGDCLRPAYYTLHAATRPGVAVPATLPTCPP